LIGLSKDTAPIIGADALYPHIYYVSCVAGLAIASAMGRYSAQHYLEGRRDMDRYFSYKRSFLIDGIAQKVLGKPLSFALNNAIKTSSF
jgi:glycine/D-amino acid oxidase-like deaminating enzyme